ncbi:hypothetical protein NFI96_009272 [Prochilodus magdalenae]|nr:hypothetical protein NFI96_009272 [Prochilodus magdalenae]
MGFPPESKCAQSKERKDKVALKWNRLSWSDSEWQRVIFSDESRFSLGGDAQRIRVWRHRGQHRDERFVVTCPEDLVSLHLHPYRTICRNCITDDDDYDDDDDLGFNTSLSNWILDFLTGRPQSVRIGRNTSSTTTLSTGAPQGCVLSPLLFTLLTHDCAAMHSSNHIIKFADDTTVVGLINKNDESAYREEVQRLTDWCRTNNLSLNVDKTKEMVVDFRRTRRDHSPLHIDGSTVEIVKSTKFLGVHLAEDLTWSLNTSTITKKAQQRLYFLRRLRKAHLPPPILTTFYRGTIESILSSCITAWFGNCTASDRKSLQRVVRTAEKIIGVSLPTITDIYTTRCIRKTTSIVDDYTHPSHTLFTLLPSGKRYRSIRALTSRLCNSFFPQAIRLLNNQSLV